MRKKGLLLLAALLALCGCTAQSNIADVSRRTMLTVVLWDYDKTSYDWKLIRAFEDSHPDVQVEVVSYPDAYYDQKMQARLLSGRQTDVFLCRTMDSLYKLYEYGVAQPLDELLAQYGHDLRDSAELVQMQQERCMPQYSTCIAQDIQQQCFELGQYGMYIGGTWYLNYLMTDYRAGRFDFRWGVTEAPVWAEDQKSSETVIQTGMGICRSSQQQELAWEFIRFAAGAEGAKIMAAEQMMPAYLDSEVEEIYRNSFYGAYLDPMVYLDRETAVGAYQDTSREQEILCDAFRQSVTGQKDIDMALRNAQREIEALSS